MQDSAAHCVHPPKVQPSHSSSRRSRQAPAARKQEGLQLCSRSDFQMGAVRAASVGFFFLGRDLSAEPSQHHSSLQHGPYDTVKNPKSRSPCVREREWDQREREESPSPSPAEVGLCLC